MGAGVGWGGVGTKLLRNPLPFAILSAQGHLSPFIADEVSLFFALSWVQVSFCHLLLQHPLEQSQCQAAAWQGGAWIPRVTWITVRH